MLAEEEPGSLKAKMPLTPQDYSASTRLGSVGSGKDGRGAACTWAARTAGSRRVRGHASLRAFSQPAITALMKRDVPQPRSLTPEGHLSAPTRPGRRGKPPPPHWKAASGGGVAHLQGCLLFPSPAWLPSVHPHSPPEGTGESRLESRGKLSCPGVP